MTEAARRGVKVRVLLDAWGSTQVSSSFFQNLKKAGGEVAFFFPLFVPYINPRINYRNHRKIVVIDGKIGYTGGFNVGNEYLGLVKNLVIGETIICVSMEKRFTPCKTVF